MLVVQDTRFTRIPNAKDKLISEEHSTRIRRYLNMTKIERIFEKEKIEYANERVREAVRDRTIDIARTMMRRGTDILLIMEVTGLSEHEIMNLQDKSATA
jgi:hypothetical protein